MPETTTQWTTEQIMGMDRLEGALTRVTDHNRYMMSVADLSEDLAEFMARADDMLRHVRNLRKQAPCRLWGHDGAVYCSVHKVVDGQHDRDHCSKAKPDA